MPTITKTKHRTELYAEGCISPIDKYRYGNVFIQDVSTECIKELDKAFGNSYNLKGVEHIFCIASLEHTVNDTELDNTYNFSDETREALLDAYTFAGSSGGYIIFRA